MILRLGNKFKQNRESTRKKERVRLWWEYLRAPCFIQNVGCLSGYHPPHSSLILAIPNTQLKHQMLCQSIKIYGISCLNQSGVSLHRLFIGLTIKFPKHTPVNSKPTVSYFAGLSSCVTAHDSWQQQYMPPSHTPNTHCTQHQGFLAVALTSLKVKSYHVSNVWHNTLYYLTLLVCFFRNWQITHGRFSQLAVCGGG